MSSVTTAPDRPEQADSAEQAWFDLEAEILVAEVEDFLATADQQRRPAQTASAPAAAARAPAPTHTHTHTISGGARWSPRPAPTANTFPTQRALRGENMPTVSNIHTGKGGDAHARHPYQHSHWTRPTDLPWAGPPVRRRCMSTPTTQPPDAARTDAAQQGTRGDHYSATARHHQTPRRRPPGSEWGVTPQTDSPSGALPPRAT